MKRTMPKLQPIPPEAFTVLTKYGFVAIESPDGTISFVPEDRVADLLKTGCKRVQAPQ